jgi:hypothetical protein
MINYFTLSPIRQDVASLWSPEPLIGVYTSVISGLEMRVVGIYLTMEYLVHWGRSEMTGSADKPI